jgi:hypothetical protein
MSFLLTCPYTQAPPLQDSLGHPQYAQFGLPILFLVSKALAFILVKSIWGIEDLAHLHLSRGKVKPPKHVTAPRNDKDKNLKYSHCLQSYPELLYLFYITLVHSMRAITS